MSSELPPFAVDFSQSKYVRTALSDIQSVVMPVVVVVPDGIQFVGTAFVVASNGVLLTATHVVDEALKICATEPRAYLAVIYIGSGRGVVSDLLGVIMPVRRCNKTPVMDLALLQILIPIFDGKRLALSEMPISPGVPAPGTLVMAVGYPKMEMESDQELADGTRVSEIVLPDLYASQGVVVETLPRRDRELNYPCMHTDAQIEGGMSGGPIISVNENGWVCGVACKGFDFNRPKDSKQSDVDYSPISYSSLIAPALGLSVLLGGEEIPLLQLARNGAIASDDSTRLVVLTENKDGSRTITFPHMSERPDRSDS